MDARIDVEDLLGLQTGEGHIIRNAGNIERLEWDVRRGISSIPSHPWLPTTGPDAITARGFIYDVDTGRLEEVSYPGPTGSIG